MTTEVISTRFTHHDAEELKKYAELKQIPLPDLIRQSCKAFIMLEQEKLQQTHLIADITQNTFALLSAVTSLSNEERKEAATLVNKELDGVLVE